MAQYSQTFDFEVFETHSSAAPQRKEKETTAQPLKKVKLRTKEQLRAQELRGLKKSVGLLCFVLTVFAIISMQISAGAENYELMREIQKVEAQLEIAESENIRLTAELNGITGIAIIDTYATDVLGMTKVENYQIECVDLSGADSVLYSSSAFGG
ncbi:MAG: hypothetical protein IJO68_06065 [Clostridia bacterium]|nr:hypothetical protein [Clostridia bacterium]